MQLKQLNVVAIGGGHGLGRVLSTLSFLGSQLTGIVATTDNGGSTGRLRRRGSTIAWGDVRNCLTQLSEDNSIGHKLFNFRFDGQDELSGHNLGNLIFYGLSDVQESALDSINLIRGILRIKTSVLPMSETPTDLMAFYPEGLCKVGEVLVDDMKIMPEQMLLAPLVKALPQCIEAINNADLIILGPGSFLTSVVPPLLVRDIANAMAKRKGHSVFIDNITSEYSPAAKLSLDEKLEWIERNIGGAPIDSIICQDPELTSDKVNIICQDLSDEKNLHHHNQEKLINALQACVNSIKK